MKKEEVSFEVTRGDREGERGRCEGSACEIACRGGERERKRRGSWCGKERGRKKRGGIEKEIIWDARECSGAVWLEERFDEGLLTTHDGRTRMAVVAGCGEGGGWEDEGGFRVWEDRGEVE